MVGLLAWFFTRLLNVHDPQARYLVLVSELRIYAITFAAYGFLFLLSFWGMWKARLRGWWVALTTSICFEFWLVRLAGEPDIGSVESQRRFVFALLFLISLVLLLLPPVIKFYWIDARRARINSSSGGVDTASEPSKATSL